MIADAAGNVYAGSGNGDSDPVLGVPGTPNVGESFIKLKLNLDRLELQGWYNAFDDQVYVPPRDPNGNAALNLKDDDLGATAPIILPDGRIVGGGKDGYFYLIDADQLRGDSAQAQRAAQANTVILQYFLASYNFKAGTRRVPVFLRDKQFNFPQLDFLQATHHIHGAPLALTAGGKTRVYVWGENDVVRAYRYASRISGHPISGGFTDMGNITGLPIDTANSTQLHPGTVSPADGNEIARGTVAASNEDVRRAGMPGGFLSLSWDGTNEQSAILWASFPPFRNGNLQRVEGELVAYDASQFETQNTFSRMTVLWRSRQNPDDDYGVFSKFCCPTVAEGRVIQPSGKGMLFIYGLKNPTGAPATGGYDLSRDAATPGFGGAGGLTLNGTAQLAPPVQNPSGRTVHPISLTQNPQGTLAGGDLAGLPRVFVPTFHAGSVFGTAPIDVRNLQTRFTVRLLSLDANNMADGFTFTVQAQGPHALGSSGSGLGYAIDPGDQTNTPAQIPLSVALAFNVVNNTLSFWRDGVVEQANIAQIADLGTHGIALNSGHALLVTISYADAAKVLTVIVVDTKTNASTGVLSIPAVDLPKFLKLGTPALAHIGFTGGTGAKSAETQLLDWSVP